MSRSEYLKAVEHAYAGRLKKVGGSYLEVPTALFIPKIDLKMPSLPEVDFYTMKEGQIELLRSARQSFSALVLSTYESILIHESALNAIKDFAERALVRPPDVAMTIPLQERMETLRKAAILVVEDLFESPSQENISRSKRVVSSFVYTIMKDPGAYLYLAKLSSHDPYTLQHSVGTAVNCIILARKLGLNTEQELMEIGLAGLLHDVGKTKVKKEIINKPGPLDEDEWEEMRMHSEFGYEIVKDHPEIPERTKRAVLEHHEEKGGTGYPHKKLDEDVDLYSKIVCIADILNALTTNRSYSSARTFFEAFKLIRDKMLHKVNEDLFRELVKIYGGDFDKL